MPANITFNPILVWFYRYLNTKYLNRYIHTFNPILVWFYPTSSDCINHQPPHFQSHFGLILSTSTVFHEVATLPCFQSHFGLILSIVRRNIVISIRFLSIPFWSDFICAGRGIPHSKARCLSIPFWSDFISLFIRTICLCSSTFNPILVWFYLDYTEDLSEYKKHFQSHFGLILSVLSALPTFCIVPTFNPILVWFYLLFCFCSFLL